MTKTMKRLGAQAATASVLMATSLQYVAAADTGANCDVNGGIKAGIDCANPGTTSKGLFAAGGIFSTIANTLIFIVGAVSVIMLIIGGLRYVLSGGESSAVKGAKDTILYSIIGIIVAVLSYAAVSFVLTRLGAN